MAPSGNKQMNTFKLNTLKDLLTSWILFLISNLIYKKKNPKRRWCGLFVIQGKTYNVKFETYSGWMFFTCTCRPECCKCTCQCKQSISKNRAVIGWEAEEDGWMYRGTKMKLWSSKGQTEWNHAFLYALKESKGIMDDVNMWHEQSQWERLHSICRS